MALHLSVGFKGPWQALFACSLTMAVFTAVYVPLVSWLGYGYGLHLVSVVVFALIATSVTLLFFRDSEGFAGSGVVKPLLAVLVVMVLVEELLLNSVFAAYGLAYAIFGLLLLPLLAVLLGERGGWLRVALEAVALIFATRVVLSPFPLGFLSLSVFLPSIYTLILAALVLYLTYRRISLKDLRLFLGKSRFDFQLSVGLGFGAFLGVVEFFVLRPQPVLAGVGFLEMFVHVLVVLGLMVGVVEELLFRGLLQGSLERVMPSWQAIGLASVMFGLMHVGWMNPLEVLLAYGAGVVFGYLANATDSLMAPMLAHGFGNVVLYMIALHPL